MAPRACDGKHTSKTPIVIDERGARCRGGVIGEVGWMLDDDVRTGRQGDIGGIGRWQNRAHGQEMVGGRYLEEGDFRGEERKNGLHLPMSDLYHQLRSAPASVLACCLALAQSTLDELARGAGSIGCCQGLGWGVGGAHRASLSPCLQSGHGHCRKSLVVICAARR